MTLPQPAADVPGPAPAPDAPLAALRARGAQAFDPVRFSYLEALARRAAQQHGALQRVLAERLGHAAAAFAQRVDAAQAAGPSQHDLPATRGPLTELVAALDHDTSPAAAPPTELRTARRFRSTWARLRIERQLARSQARVPANPGPLNSHRLVLRALRQMQETSPAYLARFMGQVEALMWIEQAALAATPVRADATGASPPKPRRTGRGQGG